METAFKVIILDSYTIAIKGLISNTKLRKKAENYQRALGNIKALRRALINPQLRLPKNLKITTGLDKFWAGQLRLDLGIEK